MQIRLNQEVDNSRFLQANDVLCNGGAEAKVECLRAERSTSGLCQDFGCADEV